ncbi:energy transducer TonB [Dyella sp. BiH032]|uniref:energy transducer TonB n=1 Tax=Dyella sp. BiH032 TaxID=3075430 RepID=UPI0028930DB7|nr:energy transducer TonB [Dyella sp. BiH032]WNL45572.1 energy transducer TonB [Dyella sp. BiH032]
MKTKLRSMPLAAVAALSVACAAPAFAQSQARRVEPERLSSYWILLNYGSVQADVPNSGQNLTKPGCVAVTYEIGTDGKPQDVTAKKVVPQSDLGSAASSVVKRFEYGPSLNNGSKKEPVSTYYVVGFNLPEDKAEAKKITDACRLPGYDQA